MKKLLFYSQIIITVLTFISCQAQVNPNKELLMQDVSFLASDELEGRNTDTEGNKKARTYILKRFKEIGLSPMGAGYESPFVFKAKNKDYNAVNLIGKIDGKKEDVIVVTAHYDHVGMKNGEIYNGADDNASGVSGLLAIARYFKANKPNHTLIFVAFDAEENGLQGAKYFVKNLPVAKEKVKLNVNMDMISRSDKNEIYAAGTHHYPHLKDILIEVDKASEVKLSIGHDTPDLGYNDWTFSSDHGPFHKEGIPFIYFGVEDHPDYHQPTDDVDKINPDFLEDTVTLILETIKKVDQKG